MKEKNQELVDMKFYLIGSHIPFCIHLTLIIFVYTTYTMVTLMLFIYQRRLWDLSYSIPILIRSIVVSFPL